MKRIASILTVISLAVLSSVGSAHAQSSRHKIVANIPFEFTAGGTVLPAGQYEFLQTGAVGNVIFIRGVYGNGLFTVITSGMEANESHEDSTLKFTTVDGSHVLTQIWDETAGVHYEIQPQHAYAELAGRSTNDRTVTARR